MTASRLKAGASGYSFKEWKGTFYPEKIKPEEMLAYYAERLSTVEINNTFYRMPRTDVLEHWKETVPAGFRFALKAAGASLCLSEREDNAPPLVETAPWGYVRLRLETCSDDDLKLWAKRLEATSWWEIHAYFMHEPTAPAYAQALMQFQSADKGSAKR